jgi:tetratricopeptide (TPR) repeat protein
MPTPSNASMRTTWIAVLLLGVAGAGIARAQDELNEAPETTLSEAPSEQPALSSEEADKRARLLFEQGRAAFEEGRYRDAWDYFRKAYLLSKRPELLYNVGQSADRLRMDREALEAFRLYLKRLPDAANRREVENRVRALEQRLRDAGSSPEAKGATAGEGPTETSLGDEKAEPTPAALGSDEGAVPAPPGDGQPTRSGWYLRLALGVGLLGDAISGNGFDATLGSATLSGLVCFGHDVDKGVVLGGGLLFDWSLAPKLHSGSTSLDLDSANLSMLAAFVDYYFAPREDGWHLLGALAVGSLSVSDPSATIGNKTAGGGALIAGGGYEWPLDREWALGVLGRLVLARMGQSGRSHTLFAPSVAFTAAWY